jgi:hypothetical protein
MRIIGAHVMQRLILIALALFLITTTIASSKPARRPFEPEPPRPERNLEGTYGCSYEGSPPGSGVVRLKIWNQRGNSFLVGIAEPTGNPTIDWEGRGVLDGERGHYDWTFPDGKQGRTTFTIDKDGHLHGSVRGGGIDWDYVGRRVEK